MEEITRVLRENKSVADMLRKIYRLRKAQQPRFSLQFLANKAGISSKGYLADVMSGRRRLNKAYASKVAKGLGLAGIEMQILVAQILKESEKDPNKIKNFEYKIESLRKRLLIGHTSLNNKGVDPLMLVRIFCTMGLFSNPPTIDKLMQKLSAYRRNDIIEGLDILVEKSLLLESRRRYSIGKNQVLFHSADDNLSHINFILSCIDQARQKASAWFENKEESYFESSIVSVDRKKYMEKLGEVRDYFDQIQSDLETSDANQLVNFNIQIYPD